MSRTCSIEPSKTHAAVDDDVAAGHEAAFFGGQQQSDRSNLLCTPEPAEQLPAELPAFKGIEAPRGDADDLKRLPNIDSKLEQRLNDLGVYHFWQIADLDAEMTEALDRTLKLKGRIVQDDWIGAAKRLVEAEAA